MPSPRRRAKVHLPDLEPAHAKRVAWADGHADLMERLRLAGLLKPGDPHYVCHHLRLDEVPRNRQATRQRRSPMDTAEGAP